MTQTCIEHFSETFFTTILYYILLYYNTRAIHERGGEDANILVYDLNNTVQYHALDKVLKTMITSKNSKMISLMLRTRSLTLVMMMVTLMMLPVRAMTIISSSCSVEL